MADNSARIESILAILRSGAASVSIDGRTIQYDLAALRRELRQLQAEDDANKGRRPASATINLGGY